eukprot:8607830-Pyramimonas_sp.AAC.1
MGWWGYAKRKEFRPLQPRRSTFLTKASVTGVRVPGMKTESRRGFPADPRTALPYKASWRFSRMAVNGGWP